MIKEVLSHFHLPILTCIALLIFFTLFCGMLFWISRKPNRKLYKTMQQLPLSEEKKQYG